jgi:hypothetical protein
MPQLLSLALFSQNQILEQRFTKGHGSLLPTLIHRMPAWLLKNVSSAADSAEDIN